MSEDLRERIARVERQVAGLLDEGGGVAAADVDLDRALRVILTELRQVVPFDSASVQERRDDRLVIVGGIGFADMDVILGESFEIDNADSPNGEVVHRRKAMIVADTERYRAFRRGLHVGANIRSWIGVPLLDRDEVSGIVTLDKEQPDFYTPDHADAAAAFATLIVAAMKSRPA